jgi:L-iditol 2-dehydrogenase
MLAYVYKGNGELGLVEKPVPHARDDTAVIKILASSICGTDFRTYVYGSQKIGEGVTVGHEMCGRIVETGKNVRDFKVGELVTVAPALGCGECHMCKKGHTNMCSHLNTLGFEYDGSFAEYMEIPARFFAMNNVNRVPEGVRPEDAALAEPIACVVNAQEFLKIEEGDTVAVFGSGFIGCMHAELAFAGGASRVIMIEPSQVRLNQATGVLPGIETVGPGEDPVQKVLQITQDWGVDVAIVACSVGAAQVSAQKIIAKRGRISLFGGLPGESTGFLDSNIIHYKEVGVFGVHASTPKQNKQVLEWIGEKKINVNKYISKLYPIADITKAFEDIKNKGIMKAVIVFG